jgi:hypothetical protein
MKCQALGRIKEWYARLASTVAEQSTEASHHTKTLEVRRSSTRKEQTTICLPARRTYSGSGSTLETRLASSLTVQVARFSPDPILGFPRKALQSTCRAELSSPMSLLWPLSGSMTEDCSSKVVTTFRRCSGLFSHPRFSRVASSSSVLSDLFPISRTRHCCDRRSECGR